MKDMFDMIRSAFIFIKRLCNHCVFYFGLAIPLNDNGACKCGRKQMLCGTNFVFSSY